MCVAPAGVEPLTLAVNRDTVDENTPARTKLKGVRAHNGDKTLVICGCVLYIHSFWFLCDSLVK